MMLTTFKRAGLAGLALLCAACGADPASPAPATAEEEQAIDDAQAMIDAGRPSAETNEEAEESDAF